MDTIHVISQISCHCRCISTFLARLIIGTGQRGRQKIWSFSFVNVLIICQKKQCNFIKHGSFLFQFCVFFSLWKLVGAFSVLKPFRFCYSYDVSNTSIFILELKIPGLYISWKKTCNFSKTHLIVRYWTNDVVCWKKCEDIGGQYLFFQNILKHQHSNKQTKWKDKKIFFGIVSAFHCSPTDLITGQLTYICANFCSPWTPLDTSVGCKKNFQKWNCSKKN